MWKKLWKMRLLRIAVACVLVFWLSFQAPCAHLADNAWRKATDRNYAIPKGSSWWTFRAADRTDRKPGWTCAEDDRFFFARTDTGIRVLPRASLAPLADPCAVEEDADTILPEDALITGESAAAQADSGGTE